MKVLIVDDDTIDRETMRRSLHNGADNTFDIYEASSCEQAKAFLSNDYFDAIILDYRLPDGTGLELIQKLSHLTHYSAILMVSQTDSGKLAEECINAGAQDFLPKCDMTPRHLMRGITLAKQRINLLHELHDTQSQLRLQAEHDTLTGLYNRRALQHAFDRILARAQRNSPSFALAMIDLDQFKSINDIHGHPAGDTVLREIAARLQRAARDCDFLARIGGDEFVILAENISSAEQASAMAQRLLDSLCTPIQLSDGTITVTASIGIALYNGQGETAESLMKTADEAMYLSKNSGRNCFHYTHCSSQNATHQQQYL